MLNAAEPQASRDNVGRVAAAPAPVGVRRMMLASKARSYFRALASSSSVPELAASSTRNKTST